MKEPTKQSEANQFLKTDGGKTKSNAIEVPSIDLPKGGGAIKGIDEKFSVNAVNGTASFSVPLPFASARGASPALSLSYNSGAGNGIFGLGWNISLGSIKRKTEKGLPQYMDSIDSDVFLFSGAEDLVPKFKKENDGTFSIDANGDYVIDEKNSSDNLFTIRFYIPRTEGLYAKIERWTKKSNGTIKWRVITKDNSTTLFGWTHQAVIADPTNPIKIFEWLPEFTFDDKGNCAHYIYKKEDDKGLNASQIHNKNRFANGSITYTNLYLEKITYGNKTAYKQFGDVFPAENDYMFQTVFDYGEYDSNAPYSKIKDWDFRLDAFSDYKAGFEIRTTRLCQRVLLFHYFEELPGGFSLIKSANFDYDKSSEQDFTFLKSTTAFGYIKKNDGIYTSKHLPAIEFEYQKHEWSSEVKTIAADDLVHDPIGLDEQFYQFTDLYNEGLSGILTEQGNAWYYKHNLGGGKFEQAKLLSPKPSFVGLGGQLQLADLDADGGKQLVTRQHGLNGYFELDNENEWQRFKHFQSIPNIDFSDANMRMIDLNGDGKSELLITEDHVFTWYESDGRNGYSQIHKTIKGFDEEAGPHLVFSDSKQTIFLADMSGDGMTDILRIRNGAVCYWPNLGYGKFGTKVAMDQAPVFDHPDAFNPEYLRLADIDGSGTPDIIYLGKNKFTCWLNLSGNRFSTEPFEISAFPHIHSQSKITVTDLLGNGIACIVWSSPLSKDANTPLRYIDLMNSKKPHIMVGYKNNLGKEVALTYTPSTQFYIEDKLAGKPWITKLHFPIHCISKTETLDKITGHRFVSSFKYHHGYYDHAEREFRGFGMVEKTDAEHFEHWVKSDATNIVDAELHQAPVVSKIWTHTGAFISKEKILTQFAKEYWHEELLHAGYPVIHFEHVLPDARLIAASGLPTTIINELSPIEWQQALRACKGMALRSEIFAQDAPLIAATDEQIKKQLTPYSVATHNCVIELLQPKGKNKYAVFVVKESEAITYSYERNPEDPRIAHSLNIKLDEYGNVLESASIVYPRMNIDATLPLETQTEQSKTHIIYTQNQLTNDVIGDDVNRLRLTSEVKTYELKGVLKTGLFYALTNFENILTTANEVSYHQYDSEPAIGTSQKRLIEHVRSTYLSNDLITPLPLHQLQSLALSYQSYQLAYTPELIADVFGAKVNDALMLEGKYTHSEGDANWWIRSGSTQFIEGAETILTAENRFYVPIAYTDPYGAKTKVKYYSNYFLFIEETEDAIGNKAKVDLFNFRTMSAQRMRDINENLSEAISDELGLVKATAVYGKGNEADDLIGFTEYTEAIEQNKINTFFNTLISTDLISQGKDLLKHATSRFIYDFDVYKNTGKPAVVASIIREEHFQKNNHSAIQLSFEYSSGSGAVILKKVQAEPGIAKQVQVNPDNSINIIETDTSLLLPKQLRWIGNGNTIINNKGKAVKQYEPYFSVTHQYESFKELVETGVTPIMYYDAMGRLIKTESPDKTFSTVIFDAWQQKLYDANDTILESDWYINRTNRLIDAELIAEGKDPGREKIAADKAAKHANTPMVYHFDTLGRPILSIEHNKNIITNADEFYRTKIKLDIESNLRYVQDARELLENGNKGNTVMLFKYDMLGNMAYQNSMDGGQRWPINNILGKPLRTWDERNFEFQYFYDTLQRPTMAKVMGGDSDIPANHIFERVFYGETELNPELKNLRGKIIKHYDTGGMLLTPEYNFKGEAILTTRKLYKDYKSMANWVDANLLVDLENDAYIITGESDALGRIRSQTTPDGSVITTTFNERGFINSKSVAHANTELETIYIKAVDYNEKGQRNKIIYGNDVTTRFYFDKETFRLNRLESKKLNNDRLQDWNYTIDPVGNITHVEDKNIPIVFYNNQKSTGVSEFTYNALYSLIEATGRENNAALNFNNKDNWDDAAYIQQLNLDDPMLVRNYIQTYQYDEVGNMIQMQHLASGNNWTRNYDYEKINNRLKTTQIGAEVYGYTHHTQHGFITKMPHLEEMEWNFKEQLVKTVKQKVNPGNGTAESTYYQYDGNGQRIRKITENFAANGLVPTKKEERIYISGYETYRTYQANAINFERETLSLMDEGHRFVMIETVKLNTKPNPVSSDLVGARLMRYQLHNHFGSSSLELDATAQVISYEEYHPFGTTAYQANNADIKAAAKRYRYTGMERDDETGLEYHSARYYIPWLGRWLSVDPIGIKGGINDFVYCINNPINRTDTSGKEWCWNVFADDCSLDTARIFGGVKVVGGVLETVGGVGAAIATAPACVSIVGCAAPVASGAVALHGLDTIISGARTVWNGEEVDSFTSQGLQAVGVDRTYANLGDATISVVGSLGTSALTRAPAAAAAAIDTTVPSITVSHAAGAPSALGIANPMGNVIGHTRVGVALGDGSPVLWSHLTVPGERVMMSADTLVQSGESVIATGVSLAPRNASLVTIPVSASEAQAAASLMRSSAPLTVAEAQATSLIPASIAAKSAPATTYGSAGAYGLFTNDCASFGTTVLNTANVSASGSTPATLLVSAALRSESPITTLLTSATVMQPVTLSSAVVNTGVGVSSYSSSSDSSSSSTSEYSSEEACYSEPDVIDYSQMVCQ